MVEKYSSFLNFIGYMVHLNKKDIINNEYVVSCYNTMTKCFSKCVAHKEMRLLRQTPVPRTQENVAGKRWLLTVEDDAHWVGRRMARSSRRRECIRRLVHSAHGRGLFNGPHWTVGRPPPRPSVG